MERLGNVYVILLQKSFVGFRYDEVVGIRVDFCDVWLNSLVVPQSGLFFFCESVSVFYNELEMERVPP